ncbi:hypothetical protein M5689_000138 [Euphorbia peplus]|nr:hypothetical protein M5689_000138 [Euphorbia peplus]
MDRFSDMVNSDYPVYDEFAIPNLSTNFSHSLGEEGSVQVTPFPSQFVSSQKVKDKRTRTKIFTKEEDVMLISAWQNIHLDEITGVNQTHETYWEKVHKYFMKYKDFPSDRNCSSLMHRWSVIQLAVSKFQGFYSQADGRSGYSEDDKIRCAKDMYKNVIKNTFSVVLYTSSYRNTNFRLLRLCCTQVATAILISSSSSSSSCIKYVIIS